MGILKFILSLLVAYYVFKILSRMYLGYIINKFKNNTYRHTTNNTKKEQEGEVTIDKTPKENSKKNNTGDYIDYEEID